MISFLILLAQSRLLLGLTSDELVDYRSVTRLCAGAKRREATTKTIIGRTSCADFLINLPPAIK